MGMRTKSMVMLLSALAVACSDGAPSPMATDASFSTHAASGGDTRSSSPALGRLTAGHTKVYRLRGTADVVEVDGALCYTIDLWDVEQDRVVGAATDCLSEIDTSDPTGVVLTGRTTFDFGKGNSFTSEGRTSVRPTMPGSSLAFTHITGAVPMEGANSIIRGTGRFADFQATVRLSGAVDLSAFPGTAAFDCLFVVSPL